MEDILLVHRKSSKNFSTGWQASPIWKTCLRQILFLNENEFGSFADELTSDDHVLRGENAFSLLLEILCGLHSPIVGETEVFGQFKSFVDTRKAANDPLFADHQKWLSFVLTEVKRTRSEHLVGIGSQSYGSLLRRHTKNLSSVSLCGSGQLAQEIIPWLAHKEHVQALCRNPMKLEGIAAKFNNLTVSSYDNSYVHGEALIIAAPLSDERICDLLSRQDTRPHYVYDLRGEENRLTEIARERFPHVTIITLSAFFAEIEATKKDTQSKIQKIKEMILEKALSFVQRTELRPLGWDDICA
jgi:glutamyl-tRNA reductase